MNAQELHELKCNLYFKFTYTQSRKFHSLGYEYNRIELISMNDFLKITKNKEMIKMLVSIKRESIYLIRSIA